MINVTKTFLPPLEEYTNYLQQIWDTSWVTNRGKLVRKLECKLKKYLGIRNILCVNNGTIALQIAIKALDLKGEIITTPFSYVATVSSIVWENCMPVFVDIDPYHLTIDETKIEEAITDQTTAILAVHVYGNPCHVEAIEAIAKRNNLRVIYDAAHCFGVKYKGRSVLNWGDISTLSFHATKLFHTGEGGAIISNTPESTDRIYYMHNFGHDGPDNFFGLGINGKSSELNAAMGLSVFPYVEELITRRKNVSLMYDYCLAGKNIRTPTLREETDYNYSYYPIIFPTAEDLSKAKAALEEEGIFPRRYFYPSLNKLPYIMNLTDLPAAEEVSHKVLCLPFYPDLEVEDIKRIAALI